MRRQPAQPFGSVPTIENYSAGEMVLKLEGGEPTEITKEDGGPGSPWEGLSGGAVTVGDLLVGIATRHRTLEGQGSITFTPLTRITDELQPPERLLLTAILALEAMEDVTSSPMNGADQPLTELEQVLGELADLERKGLLKPPEAGALRVKAVTSIKGWT